jgi:two-component system phosphate regulon sensor histidine kinase PhoR
MNSIRRIGLLLAVVFLLPALFFSVYELSSLNKDEKIIQTIYEKQLEAILFSVNQYCDDAVNSWISKIESSIEPNPAGTANQQALENLFSLNTSLTHIFVLDTVKEAASMHIYSSHPPQGDRLRIKIDSACAQGWDQIQKLVSYKQSGFRKVDILKYGWSEHEDLQCLFYISDVEGKPVRIVGLLIDPEAFVLELVGPRLQVIARDQFILSAFRKNVPTPVYSTFRADSASTSTEALTKDFWLLPDFTLGIRTKGSSLQSLVRERTTTNLALLLLLDVVLIVAVVLVYRNVKKEVQLAQNKAEFVSNVSHEIRTPLALISLFAETLEMGRAVTEEKRQEYYTIITKETRRLSDIVNKILNFSRMEANKQTLHIQPIRLGQEIKEILNTYEIHLKNKGFEYTLSESREVVVNADKEAFVEVVINLLDNAVKYSKETKRIEVYIDAVTPFGLVTIKDAGVGISAADQKHIFDKFYRVSTGDLAKSKGTGLGLSLVKQLMEAQGGRIAVYSRPGKGSSFTLYFPIGTR